MLRPAVAATNCASAGRTSGLDIGRRRLSVQKSLDTAMPQRDRARKVPACGEAVNDGLSTRRARRSAGGPARPRPDAGYRGPNFTREW